MKTSLYWHKLSQYLIIKTALPHLLLGVIAAGFSYSDKIVINVQTVYEPVSMIVFSATLRQQSANIQTQPQTALNTETHFYNRNIKPIYVNSAPLNLSRSPAFNGIRAGPLFSA